MTATYDFTGKTVLVTGASQGIGFGIARRFGRAGANTIILAENAEIFSAAKRLAEETGASFLPLQCDIASEQSVSTALAGIGPLDVLVNNAGYQPRTPISDLSAVSLEQFRRVMDINIVGTWLVTRLAVTAMKRGGRIIMTSSIWGKTGAAECSGYVASKHATIGLVRSLAMELGARGITVNCVCPGWVNTEGALWTVREVATSLGRDVGGVIDEFLEGQPLPGLMDIDDVSGAYLFLASDAARDITGQAINVDRGRFIG
jgi:NAD(P)-dependent dehydrogenase (short-subunit alcohol dehydrogenase family)